MTDVLANTLYTRSTTVYEDSGKRDSQGSILLGVLNTASPSPNQAINFRSCVVSAKIYIHSPIHSFTRSLASPHLTMFNSANSRRRSASAALSFVLVLAAMVVLSTTTMMTKGSAISEGHFSWNVVSFAAAQEMATEEVEVDEEEGEHEEEEEGHEEADEEEEEGEHEGEEEFEDEEGEFDEEEWEGEELAPVTEL
jgi:hypothetical protein